MHVERGRLQPTARISHFSFQRKEKERRKRNAGKSLNLKEESGGEEEERSREGRSFSKCGLVKISWPLTNGTRQPGSRLPPALPPSGRSQRAAALKTLAFQQCHQNQNFIYLPARRPPWTWRSLTVFRERPVCLLCEERGFFFPR